MIENNKKIPSRKIRHAVRDLYKYRTNCYGFYEEQERLYGEVSSARLLMGKVVMLLGPDANEFVLKNKGEMFSSKKAWDLLLEDFFEGGLMLRDGEDHKIQRRIMNNAFSRQALSEYIVRMQPVIRDHIDSLAKCGSISFYKWAKHLTLDIAIKVFMGIKPGKEADRVNKWFTQIVKSSISIVRLNLPFTDYGKGIRARKKLAKYFSKLVEEKRKSEDKDLFSNLVRARDEDGKAYSDKQIIDHMIFIMMAAHDTTTSSITSFVEAITEHANWQDELRTNFKEIKFEHHLTLEDLKSMGLMERCFKESLRLYPPLPSILRKTNEDLEYKGFKIERGTLIDISPAFTQRMKSIWRHPERFDPDRFSENRAEDKRHRYAWVPFGGSAHKCIGMNFAEIQVKLIAYYLLMNLEVLEKKRNEKGKELIPIVKPKDGLPVIVRPLVV